MKKTNELMVIPLFLSCLVLLTAPASAAEIGRVDIHGYIAQGYLHSTDFDVFADGSETGTFEFNELAINFSSYPTDKLLLGTQFMAMDLGNLSNDEVIIDWAFADYHWKDPLGLRVGIIKIPHGLYNETRDVDMLRVGIFLPMSVYAETFRDAFTRMIGGGIYGALPGGFSYQLLYGLSNMNDDGELANQLASRPARNLGVSATNTSVDNGFMFIANLQWESLFGLRLGASYLGLDAGFSIDIPLGSAPIPFDIEGDEMYAMVGSAEYIWKKLTISAEYAYYGLNFLLDTPLPPGLIPDSMRVIPEGWYVSTAYAFTDWFILGLYHSQFVNDKLHAVPANDWLRQWVVTTRFDINNNWIIKLEYHLMKGLYFNRDNATKAEDGDDYWHLFGAKISFNF